MSNQALKKASNACAGEKRQKVEADPYISLCWAVIGQAAEDVRLGSADESREAVRWLLTAGHEMADALGLSVDPALWRAWVVGGCKTRARKKRVAGWPVVKMPAFFPGFISESKSLGDPGHWSMIHKGYLCGGG